MTAESPDQNEGMGRVIRLRPRPTSAASRRTAGTELPAHHAPIGDLGRYERSEDRDDYRHRMITNGAALLVCIVLVVTGVWIANTMAEMRKNQDCVLSGRRGCTPVDVPVRSR